MGTENGSPPERKRYEESLRRDLGTFRLHASAHAWFPEKFRGVIHDLYVEYPAFLGQVFFFALFLVANTALQFRGIRTADAAPNVLFFAFDILTLDFLGEPPMLVFLLFAFFLAWGANKFVLIVAPRVRNASVPVLLAVALATGSASLVVFSIVFAYLVGAVV